MATVEEFETTLKEVVKGTRLSASKMNRVTEISMKLMEHDTQLVSVLYRTHKALPASSKISSLYTFDALCRAARHHVVKQNLTGDFHAEKGNCATFLLKIEGVLDGLFQDMLSSEIPEAKEKTKKILDIWTKSSTFPANVLTRLSGLVRAAENSKETKHASSSTTTDPRKPPTPPSEVTPPVATAIPTAESAQATLLALLSSAAANNVSGSQIVTNTSNPAGGAHSQAQLEQIQLALLHQLTKSTSGMPQVPLAHPPFPPGASMQNLNFPGPSSRSPPNPESYRAPERRDSRFRNFDGAQDKGMERGRGEYDDQRVDLRGGPQPPRGDYRGRGRDNYRGGGRFGEWERERNREPLLWDRRTDNGRSPPSRPRSSRSRSPPPRVVGRRDGRPHSPLPRPSLASPVDRSRIVPPGAAEAEKDEFGRDIRPTSEEPEGAGRPQRSVSRERERSTSVVDTPDTSRRRQTPPTAPDSYRPPTTSNKSEVGYSGGLESFDITTFDPTDAASWKALGDAFQVTNGYVPSQEELMALVMGSMSMMMGIGMDVGVGGMDGMPASPTSRAGYGDMHGPPDGGGHALSQQEWGPGAFGQSVGGVILEPNGGGPGARAFGGEQSQTDSGEDPNSAPEHHKSRESDGGSGGAGGQMRKVGDRWIFVRDGA